MARIRPLAFALALSLVAPAIAVASPATIELPGLQDPVTVELDRNGVPHIEAKSQLDLARVSGWVHARDRFFQMDLTRRQISGDLAEVLGAGVLGGDIEARTVGLRRAAQRSLAVTSPESVAILQAYADGVNAWLAANPLPVEYGLLELSSARPWNVVDSLALGKGLAANLSLDIDIGPTVDLLTFIGTGAALGFDGEALFFEDVRRSAPIDAASTLPDAGGAPTYAVNRKPVEAQPVLLAGLAPGAARVVERLEQHPLFAAAMKRRDFQIGSNEWGVSANKAVGRRPIMANDPHLSLDIPATFYEWHLVATAPGERMNVSGVGFPGTPGVVLGQNQRISWGATTNGLDVSDVFQDQLYFLQPQCAPALACILSDGVFHPVEIQLGVSYGVNQVGDGVLDNVVPASLPFEQTIIATVPFRSNGPVLDISGITLAPPTPGIGTALVLQFTGFEATRELETFLVWNRAENLAEFRAGLEFFDFGAQNWSYADADGNLAYFSSAESPLRKDLEAGPIARTDAPVFIRDGSGAENWVPDPARSQGQAIPYAILPFDERPQVVNPPNGFFVNANNDVAGTTLDNDPLNERRISNPSAVYYLAPGYADGLRAGRITRLIQQKLARGRRISSFDMQRFQQNTQQLDAELLTPFLLSAFANAESVGAPPELAALAADAGVAEAVGRLAAWDFSTPTGIPEGYDASDFFGFRRPNPRASEKRAAAAATIYNVWRAKLLKRVVDQTLAGVGLSVGSRDALKATVQLLRQAPFTGVGASGLDFFAGPGGLSAEQRRDAALLQSVRDALDALASSDFAAAFGNSTDQADYLWGRLHRITFDHPFVPDFSVPPAAGFEDLAPGLPGLSRDGGYEVVNASGFSARADTENGFRFGGGPVRRYVGIGGRGGRHGSIFGVNVVPGGPSGDPFSPEYATGLPVWLTGEYHLVRMDPDVPGFLTLSKEQFVPPTP